MVHPQSIDRVFAKCQAAPETDCYPPIGVLVTNRTYQARYGPSHAQRHQPRFRAALRYERATAPDCPDAGAYWVADRAGLS
jgi:hypothetical protein